MQRSSGLSRGLHRLKPVLHSTLVVVAVACFSPEVPDRPPATTATREVRATTTPPPPPLPPSVWSVNIFTTGGFSGGGKGSVSISSESPCGAAEDAVTFARPAKWKASYRREVYSGMTDQFHYAMTFVVDGQAYRTAWQDDSAGLLPDDLRKLYDAAWKCR